jgi:flagella basal body P-ring formation protein FlgA
MWMRADRKAPIRAAFARVFASSLRAGQPYSGVMPSRPKTSSRLPDASLLDRKRALARRGLASGLAAAALSLAAAPGVAAPAGRAASGPADTAEAMIERFVRERFGPQYRVELRFGRLNPNLKLDACARIEPFLSPGARLWGRTTIGVRCAEGATWSVAVPMTVAVFGPALVASRPISPNAPLSADDVEIREVELSRENRPALTDPSDVEGRISVRSLHAGQTLRDYHVRVLPTVKPGDPVRLQIHGQGFVVSSEGAAMAAAGDGQPVRVRTPGGKVMIGTVNGRTVDVRL